MKKLSLIIILAALFSIQGFSQRNATVSYSIGFGVGDLGDYIEQASFRGVILDYTVDVTDNISLGGSVGIQTFYEEVSDKVYDYKNTSASGKQYRYSNNVPILAKGVYSLKETNGVVPYGALGIGTIYTRRDTEMGIFTYRQDAWNFALAPEIGFLYQVSSSNSVALSVRYFNGFQSGSELDESQNYFSINLGFSL
jgi:hypothetical protein